MFKVNNKDTRTTLTSDEIPRSIARSRQNLVTATLYLAHLLPIHPFSTP